MPESLEDFIMLQPPTAERPLLGSIILVVEDSRHACEMMRLICQRSGARTRRAECLASADRHLRSYRPRIVVIDLGLPDGSGLQLIETLARAEQRIDGIIAISGDDTLAEAAIAAGADAFLAKPLSSVKAFQEIALKLLPADLQPDEIAPVAADTVVPDPIALRDDLALAADLLRKSPDRPTLEYLGGFLASLGKDAGDRGLSRLAEKLRAIAAPGADARAVSRVAKTIETKMNALEIV